MSEGVQGVLVVLGAVHLMALYALYTSLERIGKALEKIAEVMRG